MSKFKVGEWNKAIHILFWDLEALKPKEDSDRMYNWTLLKKNLEDLYGKRMMKQKKKQDDYYEDGEDI